MSGLPDVGDSFEDRFFLGWTLAYNSSTFFLSGNRPAIQTRVNKLNVKLAILYYGNISFIIMNPLTHQIEEAQLCHSSRGNKLVIDFTYCIVI